MLIQIDALVDRMTVFYDALLCDLDYRARRLKKKNESPHYTGTARNCATGSECEGERRAARLDGNRKIGSHGRGART